MSTGNFSFDEGVAHTVRNKWYGQYKWLFNYDVCHHSIYLCAVSIDLTMFAFQVENVWKETAELEDSKRRHGRNIELGAHL